MQTISRRFGSVVISWSQVSNAVWPVLEDTFAGVCLYQLWIRDCQDPDGQLRTQVTLVVHAKAIQNWDEVSSRASESLRQIFPVESNVEEVNTAFIEDPRSLSLLL